MTASEPFTPTGVHLVGSIPLPSVDDVFRKLPAALPGRLLRIPDGEPAERGNFVAWQQDVFSAYPQALRLFDSSWTILPTPEPTAADIDEVLAAIKQRPLDTQFDKHAFASFDALEKLRSAGKIDSNVKFQVCLPTPINTLCLVAKEWQASLEPCYEEALMRAIRNIEDHVPHSLLSIQWDVATEFAVLEGVTNPHWAPFFSPVKDGVIERLVRLVNAVSHDVDVGLHLCYGDMGHQHFIEPKDMQMLVDLANDVKARASRNITYYHMPVPLARHDDEFFAPLGELNLSGSELYLGVVHFDDLEGTKRRIGAAAKALEGNNFGVATECGMGRTPADQLTSILKISAAVSKPHTSTLDKTD